MFGERYGAVFDQSSMTCLWTRHSDHLLFGERPLPLDLDREGLERPARRELLRPSHGSPGPDILI